LAKEFNRPTKGAEGAKTRRRRRYRRDEAEGVKGREWERRVENGEGVSLSPADLYSAWKSIV